jgi:glutamate synthase domain-containing protein 2/ferredoxin/glutamate synthase domain-containing protein 1
MTANDLQTAFAKIREASSERRVRQQHEAVSLLYEKYRIPEEETAGDTHLEQMKAKVSPATDFFYINPVQEEIYHSDSGTAFVPERMKKTLLKLKSRFVIRPGSLDDLKQVIQYAAGHKLRYTIRGSGTWPFGGSIPMNHDIIIDLSHLDFYDIDTTAATVTVGPGVIFANIREKLRDCGFGLQQEITNPNSGTICGWVATGGLGLGAYKYGHVRHSVKAILLITPDGEWHTLGPNDDLFEPIFSSEGQIGIIAGVVLAIRKLIYVSKPYAFSLPDVLSIQKFLTHIHSWNLKPTSVLYFDPEYIKTTYEIGREKLQIQLNTAITSEDELIIRRIRQDLEVIEQYTSFEHVVVMEFDTHEDLQEALRHQPFSSTSESRRYTDISYRRLSVGVAHKLWEHRFAPVEMKPKGPAMLVSETILPLDQLAAYSEFVHASISFWTQNPVKTEAHLLNKKEILIQTIILADPDVRRHVFYLGLVPFMTQAALNFGARPYGVGIWNLPFIKGLAANGHENELDTLRRLKKQFDPGMLVNQCKYINPSGRKLTLRLFNRTSAILLKKWVDLLYRGKQKHKRWSLYTLGRLAWSGSKKVLPRVVPPKVKVDRTKILDITSSCAECDSCERVCPTSDVFGMYGAATPITRRKTANRIARGEKISREEALGFLVCTRCDNCTRICPTNIPLTDLFDIVEADNNFQNALNLDTEEKNDFIDRFWQITKDSPLYRDHTLADHRGDKSHLGHGLKIHYDRGFAYAKLFIDPETCIHCGMCADENACTYDAREGRAREIPILKDENCALCNACINYCPQNKVVQEERQFTQHLIDHAVDFEEKKYWQKRKEFLRDTTTIQRSADLTDMADIYVTEDILMEIDKEASTGNIPVSGMGQGDRHMGIGFDAERFSHFHIVGPAQNRLHEGDPDEELSVILGKRHRYCKFDHAGEMHNPPYTKIKLRTPILYNAFPLDSHGRVEVATMRVCEEQQSLMVMDLQRMLENYDFLIRAGKYKQLPAVIIPRVDHELIHHLLVNPHTQRELLLDLWRMPMFEIRFHPDMHRTIDYIFNSVKSLNGSSPLLCGYITVGEHEMIGGMEVLPLITDIVDAFLDVGIDVLHIEGLRNEDNYFVTSQAVRSVHHHLLRKGRRHEVAIIASGGIRLASDSQKTIQRGAEATLIDFASLLTLDPYAYRAIIEKQTTTEKLLNLDHDWAVERLTNQMESRKVQILEVLGAAGFKDLKKTVGEEGRLIDFYELEERIQKDIFEIDASLENNQRINEDLIKQEGDLSQYSENYESLRNSVVPLKKPHNFYNLSAVNQTVYQRDHVWPGWVIQSLGRMASGDLNMLQLRNVKGTGLLGDGFDVMKILYMRDPDLIQDEELQNIQTAVSLDKDLILGAPWMFGGKSVGSIGLDTWKAHVIAARRLKTQYDTGEGGYPTCFFLNRKGEPIFFNEPDIQKIKHLFEHDHHYTIHEIKHRLHSYNINRESHPTVFKALEPYPDLQSFLFYAVIDGGEEPFVSTELKTGLFGVNKETIKKANRIVIAYSQGAKMGIGGHILAQKVNKLVSYLRGIEGIEFLDTEKIEKLSRRIKKIVDATDHVLKKEASDAYQHILNAQDRNEIFPELKWHLWNIQQRAYEYNSKNHIDPLEFDQILHLCEEVIGYSYTSIISPFPFHNCYSIEDVKAFIDIVRMINRRAVISVKVSPSVDIEFIATGLGRIAKDNTEEAIAAKRESGVKLADELAEYTKEYGMRIELWLDGPRGGTGASPNIIKGQMGMHIEYAIPLIHQRLVQDGLRNFVKFFVSGGIRTYEDVIKAIALGADGIVWGTAPLVAIGCDRNRNCHDGCSRGIATTNLIMQNLRDVELNAQQITNAFLIMQMQVIRSLAALGFNDIRQLRGRHDKIQWLGLKERVDFRIRQRREFQRTTEQFSRKIHATGQSNCGVAAVIGTENIPSYILDQTLLSMKNRGMDGVGVGKTLCYPEQADQYAYRIMVKGFLQKDVEESLSQTANEKRFRKKARRILLGHRNFLAEQIRRVFLEPYFEFDSFGAIERVRESYKTEKNGDERDYRNFGSENTDPGDIYCFFLRVKKDVLFHFIRNSILKLPRYIYIREYFPKVTITNFESHQEFINKAEDLFIFDHSILLSSILYVWDVPSDIWTDFIEQSSLMPDEVLVINDNNPLAVDNMEKYAEIYLRMLNRFIRMYHPTDFPDKYIPRTHKIAAVMSAGKNFAVWKTAGREIPWETPPAPNNIIHVRLATGSVVEQMNAHPFAKLHTALTHNGETTNYETLKQRVAQFGLPPLATTDTEVASLKFHLVAEELEYPDWALFESFSPTTGDDLAMVEPELRTDLEEIQRVEFSSSPDGPYQYLCLRHVPEQNITERIDLKDPADLRPSTTAFWLDEQNGKKRAFSIIASEEQAIQHLLHLLDKEGLVDGAAPDHILVSDGMISRFHFERGGKINNFEFIDRYGRPLTLPNPGIHYSVHREAVVKPKQAPELLKILKGDIHKIKGYIHQNISYWNFQTYRWFLEQLCTQARPGRLKDVIGICTYCMDYLRIMNTGDKAKSSLVDITRHLLYQLFEQVSAIDAAHFRLVRFGDNVPELSDGQNSILVVDATSFRPEGTDKNYTLAVFLAEAYEIGWRKFILFRVNGQRLLSTAVMGKTGTPDVEIDIYGTPGEYLGAFMQGGTIRVHGNSQNFTAMCMHSGNLYVFGNAGKVCGYASKGGKVFILGNINDRAWTNSVNDTRCQNLQVHILGSASKYAGESLMGGDFFFGGLYFDTAGKLRTQSRPYRGTKLLGGASRGRFLFFDPYQHLIPEQYSHGKTQDIEDSEWPYWQERIVETFHLAGIELREDNGSILFTVDETEFKLVKDYFTLILAKGGLKGYESH